MICKFVLMLCVHELCTIHVIFEKFDIMSMCSEKINRKRDGFFSISRTRRKRSVKRILEKRASWDTFIYYAHWKSTFRAELRKVRAFGRKNSEQLSSGAGLNLHKLASTCINLHRRFCLSFFRCNECIKNVCYD